MKRPAAGAVPPIFLEKIMKKTVVFAALSVAFASQSFAAGAASLTDLVQVISFSDVLSAVFSIGVLVIGVDLAQLGYQKVRRLVKGAH